MIPKAKTYEKKGTYCSFLTILSIYLELSFIASVNNGAGGKAGSAVVRPSKLKVNIE